MKPLLAADLFAGAGGASTGLQLAATARGVPLKLVAVNHWDAAVRTHKVNHPEADHVCEAVERVDPRDLVPGGMLDLLLAGPECTFFSMARGGKPIDDQRRSSAWSILRWLELLRVERLLIENVPEFQWWAPLGANNRPLKSKRGQVFAAYIAAIQAMNYRVEYRVLNAADYGEAQTRRRLFIQAVRGRKPIVWPDPTHSRRGVQGLFRETAPWRGAKEVIDWTIASKSIFNRPKPLSRKTLQRIEEGIRRFGGKPFLLGQQGGGVARSVDDPMPTITSDGFVRVAEPFLVPFYGERQGQTPRTHSVYEPLPTIPATGGGKFGLVEPFTLPYCSNGGELARPVSEPMGTITTRDRIGLVIPDGMDIRFRLLQVQELAAGMGFPPWYRFVGTKKDVVAMIGNAWSVRVATSLCGVLLDCLRPADNAAVNY